MLYLADRIKENTLTTGIGTVTLGGAYTGYQHFSGGIPDGSETYYTIVDSQNWEVGIGTFGLSSNELSRDTVLDSTNSGSKISLSGSGTTEVFVTYPADYAIFQNNNTPSGSDGSLVFKISEGGVGYDPNLTWDSGNTTFLLSGTLNVDAINVGGSPIVSSGDNISLLVNDSNYLTNATVPSASGESYGLGYFNAASGLVSTQALASGIITNPDGDLLGSNRASLDFFGGESAGLYSTPSPNSIAIGNSSLYGSQITSRSVAVGSYAMNQAYGASRSIALGYYSLSDANSSDYNVAIGYLALRNTNDSTGSVIIGYSAGDGLVGSNNSIGVGREALFGASGDNNIAIGYRSLRDVDGTNNIAIISTDTDTLINAAFDDKLQIGNIIAGDQSSQQMSIGNITLTPEATLDVISPTAAQKGLMIQGAAAQTAHLLDLQNSASDSLLYVDSDGNLFGQNITASGLHIMGDFTYLSSTVTTIEDINIELASTSGNPVGNDAAIDGGGITLRSTDGDKTITWVDATDAWTVNQHLALGAGNTIIFPDATTQNTAAMFYNAGTGLLLQDDTFHVDLEHELLVTSGDNISVLNNDAGYVTTDTTYTAGTGLILQGTEFHIDTEHELLVTSGDNISVLTNDSGYITEHPSVDAASDSDNSGRTYIQDLLFDSFGHVTGVFTATETVTDTDTTYTAGTGLILQGTEFHIDTDHELLVTSGDNISLLNNDAGYLTSATATGTPSGVGYFDANSNLASSNDIAEGIIINPEGELVGSNRGGGLAFFAGDNAGLNSSFGSDSVYIGTSAGENRVGGDDSVCIGTDAGKSSKDNIGIVNIGRSTGASSFSQASGCDYAINIGYSTGAENENSPYGINMGERAGWRADNNAHSIFIGYRSGYQAQSATYSTCIGSSSGYGLDNSNKIVAIGGAGGTSYSNDSTFIQGAGSSSSYITQTFMAQYLSGFQSSNIDDSIIIGWEAARSAAGLEDCIGLGRLALRSVKDSSDTQVIGRGIFSGGSGIHDCIAIGRSVAGTNSTHKVGEIQSSIMIGATAGWELGSKSITQNDYLISLGYQSVYKADAVANSIHIGYQSGYSVGSSKYGVYIGYQSAYAADDVNYSVGLGYRSLYQVSGDSNILINSSSTTADMLIYNGSFTNKIQLGKGIAGDQATQQLSIGDITLTPTATLDVISPTAAQEGLLIKGAAAQSADLLTLTDSSDSELVVFDSAGDMVGQNITTSGITIVDSSNGITFGDSTFQDTAATSVVGTSGGLAYFDEDDSLASTADMQFPITIDASGDILSQSIEVSGTFTHSIYYDNGNSGAAISVDWTKANDHKITLNNNALISFTDPPASAKLLLTLMQDPTGSRTVTWPLSMPGQVFWPGGGTAPTLSTGANAVDILTFFFDGSGYYGSYALDYQ